LIVSKIFVTLVAELFEKCYKWNYPIPSFRAWQLCNCFISFVTYFIAATKAI